ncbi:MAG: hypothetical protein R6V34_11925 [Bacteroidales bacterium]
MKKAILSILILLDDISKVEFIPVKTDALKLEVEMGEKSVGLYEWSVK